MKCGLLASLRNCIERHVCWFVVAIGLFATLGVSGTVYYKRGHLAGEISREAEIAQRLQDQTRRSCEAEADVASALRCYETKYGDSKEAQLSQRELDVQRDIASSIYYTLWATAGSTAVGLAALTFAALTIRHMTRANEILLRELHAKEPDFIVTMTVEPKKNSPLAKYIEFRNIGSTSATIHEIHRVWRIGIGPPLSPVVQGDRTRTYEKVSSNTKQGYYSLLGKYDKLEDGSEPIGYLYGSIKYESASGAWFETKFCLFGKLDRPEEFQIYVGGHGEHALVGRRRLDIG